MALVHPSFTAPGTELSIRTDGGAISRATVVKLPHHDPDNLRQK